MGFTVENTPDYVRVYVSQTGLGVRLQMVLLPSDNGGGIVFAKIEREGVLPIISEREFLSIVNSTKQSMPTLSYTERQNTIAQINQVEQQRQDNSDNQQKLDAIKMEGVMNHGMAGVYGMIGGN